MGTISFETKSSEALACSCGNTVMGDGFDDVESYCENPHYVCASCGAYACVDFGFRVVNNIDTAQAGA